MYFGSDQWGVLVPLGELSWRKILLGKKNLGDGPEQFYSGEGVCLASNQLGLDAQYLLSPFGVIPKCRINVIPEDGRLRPKPSTQKIYIRGRRHAEIRCIALYRLILILSIPCGPWAHRSSSWSVQSGVIPEHLTERLQKKQNKKNFWGELE